jgi:hypothetical protein
VPTAITSRKSDGTTSVITPDTMTPTYSGRAVQGPNVGERIRRRNASAVINSLRSAGEQIGNDFSLDQISITFDNDMRTAEFHRLLRKQCGMDSAVNDIGSALPGHPSDLHATNRALKRKYPRPQRIPGVNAYPYYITRRNVSWRNLL